MTMQKNGAKSKLNMKLYLLLVVSRPEVYTPPIHLLTSFISFLSIKCQCSDGYSPINYVFD